MEYLNGGKNFKATQWLIGFDILFRGYIVKDWMGNNTECTQYKQHNKVIVKM